MMVTKQISERAAQRARLSMTRQQLQRAIAGGVDPEQLSENERAELRLVRQEHQADTDMDLDPAYKNALRALEDRLGARRVYNVLFHPEKFLADEVTYPLTNDEAALVLAELLKNESVTAPGAWTLERMIKDDLLPAAPQIGGGSLPRNAYFARHVVAAAYRTLFVKEKPEALKAEVAVAQRQLEPATATYLRMLPNIDRRIVEMAERGR